MSEYITEHGEIIEDTRSPYQVACSQLVAFKLKTIETVAADPKLHGAPCVQAIVVYLSFLKVDKVSLKPTSVYASSLTLMARGGIKSDRTARNARALLVDNHYLVTTGTTTKDGCVRYHVENPRAEVVKMHTREAAEYLSEKDAERKKEERRRKNMKSAHVPVESTTPENGCPGSNYQDVPVESTDKYHRGYLGDSLYEVEEPLKGYSPDQIGDEETLPLPIPESDAEAEAMMDQICAGRPGATILRARLMSMLKMGVLTLRLANNMLGPKQEAAA
ncbi:hypothetical protein G3A56_02505 [Rhizobium oryzihabitans]|uniref:Uncharacterized protein n=1 Tax=Rhizobium oryzihabitans TaxID=2267833 RepID=A0A7L5BE69_9HYPH|nr:hypothetical protein [Rhizobium oryzihabitans]QIB37003.1 hypothetical protein G3A56_02505 [Rhizobium oryzihabitans]